MAEGTMMEQEGEGECIILPFEKDTLRASFGRGNDVVFCGVNEGVSQGEGRIVCDYISPALVCNSSLFFFYQPLFT